MQIKENTFFCETWNRKLKSEKQKTKTQSGEQKSKKKKTETENATRQPPDDLIEYSYGPNKEPEIGKLHDWISSVAPRG